MILKALYDYYNRCGNLPMLGMEEKEIGFLLVLSKEGKFIRFEDCRVDKDTAKTFLVRKHVSRTSAISANYLYDSAGYVFGYSGKEKSNDSACLCAFIKQIQEIRDKYPDNIDLNAVCAFYEQSQEEILAQLQSDSLWLDIMKCLTKKYSVFSFRIEGDTKIIAGKKEILDLDQEETDSSIHGLCLITGEKGALVETTTATMIQGSQATAKLVSFQVNSGYDSYGKSKGLNAPMSREAEFAYTTALNTMLLKGSRNKCVFGNRTFLFWASDSDDASLQAETAVFNMLGFIDDTHDDPNARIEEVRRVFKAIQTGRLHTSTDARFYILGLAPNAARISVVYWSDISVKEFAGKILQHFEDMKIVDGRKDRKPYLGLRDMLSAITLGGKQSEVTPNIPDALARSIFEGSPYPETLFSSCIRRIKAEQEVSPYGNPCRAAILKAYLNRLNNDNNKRITVMLDKENTNQGYLCGRLFAVLDKIQDDANHIHSIQERYMNSASTTPAAVFATILNLSSHHSEKLTEGSKVYYEKLKQEIIDKLLADGFPAHLDLQDQGRFFIGFYHQRQAFFTKNDETTIE